MDAERQGSSWFGSGQPTTEAVVCEHLYVEFSHESYFLEAIPHGTVIGDENIAIGQANHRRRVEGTRLHGVGLRWLKVSRVPSRAEPK